MITCCADCEKRYINCHSKCEAYLQQRAEHEAEKDVIRDVRKKKRRHVLLFPRFQAPHGETGKSKEVAIRWR